MDIYLNTIAVVLKTLKTSDVSQIPIESHSPITGELEASGAPNGLVAEDPNVVGRRRPLGHREPFLLESVGALLGGRIRLGLFTLAVVSNQYYSIIDM